jgi:hypothetical protein
MSQGAYDVDISFRVEMLREERRLASSGRSNEDDDLERFILEFRITTRKERS